MTKNFTASPRIFPPQILSKYAIKEKDLGPLLVFFSKLILESPIQSIVILFSESFSSNLQTMGEDYVLKQQHGTFVNFRQVLIQGGHVPPPFPTRPRRS